MAESVITVKLRLKEPTNRKKKKIESFMRLTKVVKQEVAKRMPSIPEDRWDIKTDNIWYHWLKDIRKERNINANSLILDETVQAVRETFSSWKENDKKGERPSFEKENKIHYRKNFKIEKNNGTYYLNVPFESGKGTREYLPFHNNDYNNYFLKRITNDNLNFGSGILLKKGDKFYFNLSVKREVDVDYEPETFIGVDLGLNTIAWAVALDEEGNFLDETHFDGSQAGHIRDRYNKLRRKLQKKGLIEKVKEIGSKEKRWMENLNHNISNDIIEFASQFKKPIIILEDITNGKIREETENPDIHFWTHGRLRDMIRYKAKEEGIKTKLINPAYTSRKCPKCGYTDEANRNGIKFKCKKCGYENHSDFVGARNIGLKR